MTAAMLVVVSNKVVPVSPIHQHRGTLPSIDTVNQSLTSFYIEIMIQYSFVNK